MRSLFFATLNRLVRNEPGIAAAPEIASSRVRPAHDVTLVLVWDSDGEPIEVHTPSLREVKNVFVAIVEKTFRIDRLEVAVRANLSFSIFDRYGFNPVNHILQNKHVSQSRDELMR